MQTTATTAPTEALPLPIARRIGGFVALVVGFWIGTVLACVLALAAIMYSGGLVGMIGLQALITFNNLHYTLFVTYMAFPIALWALGKELGADLATGKLTTLLASARFCFGLSIMLWAIFLVTQLAFGKSTDLALWLFGSIVMALLTGLAATFSFGLLIAFAIRKKHEARIQRRISR